MGSSTYVVTGRGKDVNDAFRSAIEQARWQEGHSGYSGTIAEKSDVVLFEVPKGMTPGQVAQWSLDSEPYRLSDEVPTPFRPFISSVVRRVDDKYGPSGAVRLTEPDENMIAEFLLFGWASC